MRRKGRAGTSVGWRELRVFGEMIRLTAGQLCVNSMGALLKECNSWGNSAGLVTWAFLWFGPCGLPRERGYNKMGVKLKRAVFLKTLLRAVFNSICNNGSWRWGWGKGHFRTEG